MKLYQNSYIHRINHRYSGNSKPPETVMATEYQTMLHRRNWKCKFQPGRSTQSPQQNQATHKMGHINKYIIFHDASYQSEDYINKNIVNPRWLPICTPIYKSRRLNDTRCQLGYIHREMAHASIRNWYPRSIPPTIYPAWYTEEPENANSSQDDRHDNLRKLKITWTICWDT